MDTKLLRTELGLKHSEWQIARQLKSLLHAIDQLSDLNKSALNKKMRYIALELYGCLFQASGFDVLDKKRRCLWLFEGYVSYSAQYYIGDCGV